MCGGVSAVACPPPDGVTHYFIDLIIRFSSFIVRFLIIFWLLLFELDYLRDALVRSHACAHACVRPRAHAPHTRCLSVSQVSVTSNYIANLSGLRPHGHDDDMRCRLPCGGAIQSQHYTCTDDMARTHVSEQLQYWTDPGLFIQSVALTAPPYSTPQARQPQHALSFMPSGSHNR
jgi:hypothetical protein